MAPIVTEKTKYTYEDYLKTPEDERYELIGGDLIMTPSPVPRHQRISGRLEFELRKQETDKGSGLDNRQLKGDHNKPPQQDIRFR